MKRMQQKAKEQVQQKGVIKKKVLVKTTRQATVKDHDCPHPEG